MQDFQSIPGLTDRIFTATVSENNRRVSVFPSSSSTTQQQQQQQQHHHPQAPTKCPRCESANTKFCYYNNYNLSQPRHFCKSCRRYWTKGGVLRNVPVGGGCRKNNSKRSSKSSSSSSKPDKKARRRPPAAASGSSSETSSTLTASKPNPNSNPKPDPILEVPIFLEGAGSFSSLIIGQQGPGGFSFSDPSLMSGYRVGDPGAGRKFEEEEEEEQEKEAVDLQVNGSGLDWSGSLFDITSSVDPAEYWNQNHWLEADPSLFLP